MQFSNSLRLSRDPSKKEDEGAKKAQPKAEPRDMDSSGEPTQNKFDPYATDHRDDE